MFNIENECLNNLNNFNFEVLPLKLRKKIANLKINQQMIFEEAQSEYKNLVSKKNFIDTDEKMRKIIYPTSTLTINKNKNRYNNAPATENSRIGFLIL